MNNRPHISLETKLAAALLQLGDIPYEHAKLMSVSQILSLYGFDHYPIRYADGGPSEPWNLTPRLIADHRHKTSTVDIPQIAKRKRIQRALNNSVAEPAHPATAATVGCDQGKQGSTALDPLSRGRHGSHLFLPKRPSRWPQGRKIPSRPFPKRVERRS